MNGSAYTGTEFGASFRNLAMQTNVTSEKGVSYSVSKTGAHAVSITVGPTEAVNAYNAFGVDAGVAKVMLGRNDRISGTTLKTAQFDLSTKEGEAAYNDFLANGHLPTNDSKGVSDVTTINKIDYNSQTKADFTLGPLNGSINGNKNTDSMVATTYPDGTTKKTVDLQDGKNVPWSISQTFDKNGKEDLSQRTYTATLNVDRNISPLLLHSLKDSAIPSGVKQVTLTFTQDQMTQLMHETQQSARSNRNLEPLVSDNSPDGKFLNNTQSFVLAMVRSFQGNDYGVAQQLFFISQGSHQQINATLKPVGVPANVAQPSGGTVNSTKPQVSAQQVQQWADQFPKKRTPQNNDPRNIYEIKHTGPENIQVQGGGQKIWADGVDAPKGSLEDAKYVANSNNSPYVNGSKVPDFVRQSVREDFEDEVRRYGAIINDPKTPVRGLEIITNSPEAVPYFNSVLKKYGVPGRVVVKP